MSGARAMMTSKTTGKRCTRYGGPVPAPAFSYSSPSSSTPLARLTSSSLSLVGCTRHICIEHPSSLRSPTGPTQNPCADQNRSTMIWTSALWYNLSWVGWKNE